jgi:ABC-type lipoprotein release transport system permease subunit
MQIFLNILLYGFLAYWLITAIISQDYWYAFVVLFVVVVSVVIALLPGYHASKVSPGEYPYED